jgi:hypothetical protein
LQSIGQLFSCMPPILPLSPSIHPLLTKFLV